MCRQCIAIHLNQVGCSDTNHLGKTQKDVPFKVGHVVSKNVKETNDHFSVKDLYSLMCESMLSIANERETGDSEYKILQRTKIVASSEMQFFLLSKYIDRPVILPNFENGSDKTSLPSDASFILYNYARITQLLCSFKRQNDKYGDLVLLENVDFSHLREQEEWEIVFNLLLPYQELMTSFSNIQQFTCKNSKGKINKSLGQICGLLKNLSNVYSKYYRRVRVLREGPQGPTVIQTLNARIYLLLAIKIVYEHAFNILGIRPVDIM